MTLRNRITFLSLVSLSIFTVWFGITGYHRGRVDLLEVQEGRAPKYAKVLCYPMDGGSVMYVGRDYYIFRMHRLLLGAGNNPPFGYLGGVKLEWRLPIRLFLSDNDDYFYIPDKNTNQPFSSISGSTIDSKTGLPVSDVKKEHQ
jgi:hypothetical protein